MKCRIRKTLMTLLGFGSFAACDGPDMYGCPPVIHAPEYGVPYAEYVFNLEIVDSQINPIEGIRVSIVERGERLVWDSSTEAHEEEYCDTLGVGMSGPDGRMQCLVVAHMGEFDDRHEIACDDVDGPAGGGEYESKSVKVIGAEGQYRLEMQIGMHKKDNQ